MALGVPRNISRFVLTLLILFGSGSSCLLFSQTHITTNGNIYKRVIGGGVIGTDSVIVDNLTDFAKFLPGDTVLLMQMKGVVSDTIESASYGRPTFLAGSPGKYEFLIILSTNSGTRTIRFRNLLNNSYDIASDIQLIRVPSYYSAIIDAPGFTCPAWDSTAKTGGVLTMIVGKTLTLNYDIDVSGKGFLGGPALNGDGICTNLSSNLYKYNYSYTNSGLKGEGISYFGGSDLITSLPILPYYAKGKGANMTGGGAGNGMYAGGGGGANIGAGGRGGSETCIVGSGGAGGKTIKSTVLDDSTRLFLGGGGGGSTYKGAGTATAGGRGGGIVIILCNELDGNGHSVKADGLAPAGTAGGTGGAGGGGAGGSIAIYLESFKATNLILSAKGGAGGNSTNSGASEGGGGGGGLIWINIATPGNVTNIFTGGLRGTNGGLQQSTNGLTSGTILKGFIPALNGFLFNTINSSITGNLTDSICSDHTPYPILGTVPVGGSGNYTYLWQKKNTGAGPWSATGGSVQNYTFPGLEADTFLIRRVITDNISFLTDTSKPALIIVQSKILNNHVKIYSDIVSVTDTVCFGDNPKLIDQYLPDLFVPTSKAGALFYYWQDSSQTATWGTALGNTKSFDPNPPGGLQKTTWYRRKIVSGRCADSTAIVKFTVLPVIADNKISAAQEICHGMTFADLKQQSGFVVSGGDNTYRYKWQLSSTGAAGSWNNATGTINASGYNPPESGPDTEIKSYYRRMTYSGNHNVCQDSSSSLLLTEWKKISNNIISSIDQTICSGSIPLNILANSPADGNHTYTITWQQKHVTGNYAIAAGPNPVDQLNYQPPALTDSTWYRRYITSSYCKDSSNIVVVNVHKPITNNKIALPSSISLKDTIICINQLVPMIKGADPSGGTNNPVNDVFLWQVSSPANNSWGTATGTVNGMSYQTGILANASTSPLFYYYRRIFSSGQCLNNVSDTVTVRVLPKIANNAISADQAVCYNTAPATLTQKPTFVLSGGDGAYKALWQQSTNAGITWNTALNTSDQQNYSPPALSAPMSYRRWIYSGLSNCCKDSSNILNITINPLPESVISPASDTICDNGSQTLTYTINVSTASPWNIVYKETNTISGSSTLSARIPVSLSSSTIPLNYTKPGASTSSVSYLYTIDTLIDKNGCKATLKTGSRNLVVYKVPAADAGSDLSNCGPTYTLTGANNVGTGRWFYPGVQVVDSTISGKSFTVTVDSTLAGLSWPYKFLWKVVNWKCPAKDSVTITFDKRASQADAGPDQDMFIKDIYDTLRAVTPAVGTGLWTMVSGGASFLNDTIVFNLSPQDNVFKWTVTNGVCSTSDEMSINAKNPRFPEGFSPNGDLTNDEFEIQGFDPDFYEINLKILNSAGSQVYSTDNINGNVYKQWNGENEKGPLPDGTYYYVFTAKYKSTGKADPAYNGVIVLKRDK